MQFKTIRKIWILYLPVLEVDTVAYKLMRQSLTSPPVGNLTVGGKFEPDLSFGLAEFTHGFFLVFWSWEFLNMFKDRILTL